MAFRKIMLYPIHIQPVSFIIVWGVVLVAPFGIIQILS